MVTVRQRPKLSFYIPWTARLIFEQAHVYMGVKTLSHIDVTACD